MHICSSFFLPLHRSVVSGKLFTVLLLFSGSDRMNQAVFLVKTEEAVEGWFLVWVIIMWPCHGKKITPKITEISNSCLLNCCTFYCLPEGCFTLEEVWTYLCLQVCSLGRCCSRTASFCDAKSGLGSEVPCPTTAFSIHSPGPIWQPGIIEP